MYSCVLVELLLLNSINFEKPFSFSYCFKIVFDFLFDPLVI